MKLKRSLKKVSNSPLIPLTIDFRKTRKKKIAWELWARPALVKEKPPCIVAISNEHVIGFLIWGSHQIFGECLGIKTGSIVLLAAKAGFKAGSQLVEEMLKRFKDLNVKLVTVGTDSDNLPALGVYEKSGFKTILMWATSRFYSNILKKADPETDTDIEISEYGNETIDDIIKLYARPNAYLLDIRLPQSGRDKIMELCINDIKTDIRLNKLKTFLAKYKKNPVGYITIEYEKNVSELAGKPVYRINDLSVKEEFQNKKIALKLLKKAKNYISLKNKEHIIEVFCALNNYKMLRILQKSGFHIAHCATNLHKILP